MRPSPPPTLRIERAILRSGVSALACADEAGRGALSGPVSVGVVVVTTGTRPAPRGVRDSKLLTPSQRLDLVPQIEEWAPHSVGMASAAEIDVIGIIAALRLAGHRALAALSPAPDHVLLDGHHDYLSEPPQARRIGEEAVLANVPTVTTLVKGDLRCAGVAAASILAKTARDLLMLELDEEHPGYRWGENKGYGSSAHYEALRKLGPSPVHRTSFKGVALPPRG